MCSSPNLTHPLRRSPSPRARGLFFGWWILRLRLRLPAEWQGGRHTAKSENFRIREPNRKEIWCRVDWLGWCCVHRFWIDPVPIVFGMMLWELALEWSFSYWFLIDECFGFGLMLCKFVFNWFMSLIRNKGSSLWAVCSFILSWNGLLPHSPHPHVILHAGLARSCRIHCFNKRKTNSSLLRSCLSVWIKGGGKWSSRHSPTVCDDPPLPEGEG